MDKFVALFDKVIAFMMKVFQNLGVFSEDSKLPGVLGQYYEDFKTVASAALE